MFLQMLLFRKIPTISDIFGFKTRFANFFESGRGSR